LLVEAQYFFSGAGKKSAAPFDCLPRQALRTGFDKLRVDG
jgi:hypothetical protein